MRIAPWLLAAILAAPPSARAVSLFQSDDFSGGTDGWTSGPPNPNPPVQIAGGGPAGAGDAYLEITSNGSDGAGGRLVAFNDVQWSGDYLAERVTEVAAHLANLGATDLVVRMAVTGPGGTFVSAFGLALSAGSGWQSVVFPIAAADLTGAGDPNATLAAAFDLRILHAAVASFPGDPIAGTLGVDNVRAVPEPATVALLAPAAALLLLARPRAHR